METNSLHKSLFSSDAQIPLGVGFHNVGGNGVLRASNEAMTKKIELHYGERCGHLPLEAQHVRVLVSAHTPEIHTQMEYLGQLFSKEIIAVTAGELKAESSPEYVPFVVPYVNVPETERFVQQELGGISWGLPGKMTHLLKNKATFHRLVDELAIEGFRTPDYIIAQVGDVAGEALRFLGSIEELYTKAGLTDYPIGVMMRAAESDGNYGCCLAHEHQGRVVVVIPDGDAGQALHYTRWNEALTAAQELLSATMDLQKETRIVVSRYIEVADSPGMSVVLLDGQITSLGWNGQLQKDGSKACVGTSTYVAKNTRMQRLQQRYEGATATYFEALLRKTAEICDIDFHSLRGVANLDILIPGAMERKLQRFRGQAQKSYIAECNPRWTNYTDAIMVVLGASRREQTIANMQAVIQEGICTFDKYPLPAAVDPYALRASIFERDAFLQQYGTRIICRMTKNPMGLIFAGDLKLAQREFDTLVTTLANR